MRSTSKNKPDALENLLLAASAASEDGDGEPTTKLRGASKQALIAAVKDPQLSQSLLRGLSILSSFGPNRDWLPITELARQIGMSSSTTHRYVKTLLVVGLLEQDPRTREYRPAAPMRPTRKSRLAKAS
ncbi:MAG TPA: helix-turn-helix domain-containing protein [Solirubrobacteraceae bacterium]|nr:helix-turn-helix domain-containing protein [Solirubrobacteraceae bacterium]